MESDLLQLYIWQKTVEAKAPDESDMIAKLKEIFSAIESPAGYIGYGPSLMGSQPVIIQRRGGKKGCYKKEPTFLAGIFFPKASFKNLPAIGVPISDPVTRMGLAKMIKDSEPVLDEQFTLVMSGRHNIKGSRELGYFVTGRMLGDEQFKNIQHATV